MQMGVQHPARVPVRRSDCQPNRHWASADPQGGWQDAGQTRHGRLPPSLQRLIGAHRQTPTRAHAGHRNHR